MLVLWRSLVRSQQVVHFSFSLIGKSHKIILQIQLIFFKYLCSAYRLLESFNFTPNVTIFGQFLIWTFYKGKPSTVSYEKIEISYSYIILKQVNILLNFQQKRRPGRRQDGRSGCPKGGCGESHCAGRRHTRC